MPVTLLYTDYKKSIYKGLLEDYQHILPQKVKDQVYQFRKWQDRQAFILGRLLIWKGLKAFFYRDDCLDLLQLNPFGKPYIDQPVSFNLSHSGRYVLCGFNEEEIGVDIEKISPVEPTEFEYILSPEEKQYLATSGTPLSSFFSLWARKESVIKADGRGISLPLRQINVLGKDGILVEGNTWHAKEINHFPNHCCAIATKTQYPSIIIEKVVFKAGFPGQEVNFPEN